MASKRAWPPAQEEKSSPAAAPKAAKNYPPKLTTLKKRKEFLYVYKGHKVFSQSLIIQARLRNHHKKSDPRQNESSHHKDKGNENVQVGFVATKKVGGAVQRNRAKRQMRALAQQTLLPHANPNYDYVLIAHPTWLTKDYKTLKKEMKYAIKRLTKKLVKSSN